MSLSSLFATDPHVWAAHVASQGDWPDQRLGARFADTLAMLADKPSDSIPQATGSKSQAKGTYRLFDNERLDVEDFMQPLVQTTLDCMRGMPAVLSVQDTTSLNYSTLKHTTGLGSLNDSQAKGLHMHSTLAVRTDGVAIGLLHQLIWSRPEDKRTADERRQLPIEEKESYKWLDGIQGAETAVNELPEGERPRLIHVFDREGDIHEVLEHISGSPHGAVIRCAQKNRKVAGPLGRAYDAVAAAPLLGVRMIDIPAGHAGKARQGRCELRSESLTITPDQAKHPERHPVTWNLIEVREVDTSAGVEPVHWLLWTTEAANTVEEILAVLQFYKFRWRSEDFHLTIKSGCKVEALQLETAVRLEKAVRLYSAVAVRVLALRDLARVEPDAPCTAVLSRPAWHALYTHFEGKRPTKTTPVPTVQQAVRWIGRLGGHLGRKRDGMPGVRTLWRGWRDLTLLTTGWCAAEQSQ